MEGRGVIWILIAILIGVILYFRHRERRLFLCLDAMIKDAKQGRFQVDTYDETLLSVTENQMKEYLHTMQITQENLERERTSIQSLVADISHQTKTPIANILLYGELLQEGYDPHLVTQICSQSEKLDFLIQSLIKTSRLETGVITLQPQLAPVDRLFQEALTQILPKAEGKGIAIQTTPTNATALFDLKWTGEALYNLLDNAVKYTATGGTVSLSCTAYQMFCRIDVRDTGVGIPEAEQAQVFSRFYRSPSVHGTEGIGLGLYLAREIVSRQGGYIKLQSGLGEGSVFSVYLPMEY